MVLVVLNKKVRVARELLVVNNGVAPHTLNNYLIYVISNPLESIILV